MRRVVGSRGNGSAGAGAHSARCRQPPGFSRQTSKFDLGSQLMLRLFGETSDCNAPPSRRRTATARASRRCAISRCELIRAARRSISPPTLRRPSRKTSSRCATRAAIKNRHLRRPRSRRRSTWRRASLVSRRLRRGRATSLRSRRPRTLAPHISRCRRAVISPAPGTQALRARASCVRFSLITGSNRKREV